MRCVSCQTEINPQWKHAININVCPFCGKEIMEEKLKDLFSTLSATMEGLKDYQEQLDDWMLSNFNYVRTDSKKLAQFLPKGSKKVEESSEEQTDNEAVGKEYIVNVETEEGVKPVVAKKIQSEERTNDFFKRAEAVKPGIDGFTSTAEKTKHIKNLVKQIKSGGSEALHAAGSASLLSAEIMDQADPEAVAELQALIDGGDPLVSSLPDPSSMSGDDDEIPAAVLAMSAKASASSGKDARDLARLQQQVNKAQRSSGGSFSRSGG